MELVNQVRVVKRNESVKTLDSETADRHDRNIFTAKEVRKKFPGLALKNEELVDRAEADEHFVKIVFFESRGRLESALLVCAKNGSDWVLV